jgi:hypothetical protein
VALRKAVDRRLADAKFPGGFHGLPYLTMEKTSIGQGIRFSNTGDPVWEKDVEMARVESFDDKSVTFATTKLGLLTVSRENGIMTRQSVTSDKGEVRSIDLTKLELNPGEKALAAISAGWDTKDAKQTGAGAITVSLRKQVFSEIVSMVESGKASLAKLEEVLGEQGDALRQFTGACISDTAGIGGGPEIKALLDRVKEHLREKWKKQTPADMQTEKSFEDFLTSPEVRREVRDSMAESLLRNDKVAGKRAILELFGPRDAGDPLWHDEAGEAAWELIDKAVARAYFEALMERKMALHWGEREGLE